MQGWRRPVRGLAVTLAVLLGLAGLAAPASAAFGPDPIGPEGWEPDGPVHAIATAGDRVVVGGSFTGGVVALDASTGALLWTGNADGDVRALAVTDDGSHVLVGGAFDTMDGARHRKLASLRITDGAVVPTWRASAGGTVRDIAVVDDVAYFGGVFARHNGIDQRSLGAVRVGTGAAVPAFDVSTDAKVFSLDSDGSRLFLGGNFLLVNGQPRNSIASVTLAGSSLDAWAPVRACGGCNRYWDLLVDSGRVYTANRNAGAATTYDAVTGAIRWRVTANGDAQALALVDGLLYVGGHFVEIGNPRQPRTILAALNPVTGAVDPDFRPRFVTTWPGIWALAGTSQRLYAGGHFTGAGPSPPRRYPYFAMFG
jgi:outer membrane protein assembly factor BamB